MSIKAKPNKAKALAGVQALITGTQKHLPSGSLTIGNTTFSSPSLVQLLQSLADAMTKQDAAKTAAKDSLTELADAKNRIDPVIQGYKELLVATYGNASQTLADFGLAPRKARAPLTVEQKAAAKAKAAATRIARATKGPKAKLAIKGTAPNGTHTAPAATTTPTKTS
jgi:hypothetical protein